MLTRDAKTRRLACLFLDEIRRPSDFKDTREEYNALCNFLHSPVTSSFFAPNIFLRPLFSNTLNLCFSLSVRVQVSQHTEQPSESPSFTTIQKNR
ncbi:hypothetical protein ANN_25208 [Periplaneta americana]|uniref:Uncharacterized protein n=1 Tax=Periplaneta americana TaxID=6978 RepID=A0ABQ8S1B3_PERAM|nr:hypothetical protein ANN_25208 [Periplaneta americana]